MLFSRDVKNLQKKYGKCPSKKFGHHRKKSNYMSDGLPIILDAFFRFNAHGELINEINLINYINIALKNPHCTFSVYGLKNLISYQNILKIMTSLKILS